ncbi:tryptophan 2,3-dioxygenase family protein [Lentzea sp. NPDC051213]|uniref:tryptophan 2,3-dioxygenase family protein n=1 Tax=Lentzea sp. NPDC051213 TaxID=3364126 RepID=UPI0037877E17
MSPAGDLRDALTGPLFNQVLKKWVGEGNTDYERYLRTSELLALQGEPDELSHPDELMFQVVHQAQELWLKLLTQELAGVVEDLDRDALWEVVTRLDRVVRIMTCLHQEMGVLETMPPQAFQVVRHNLGEGSGQESPGFNAVLTAAGYVNDALGRLLARREVKLINVYGGAADLTTICERLLDFDEGFQRWLIAHYLLVRRTIGVGRETVSLDGMPARVLLGRMTKPLFRELWTVRDEMTAGWRPRAAR